MKTKPLITLLLVLAFSAGCARFSTKQTEVREDEKTTITTKATSYTLFQGSSALTNWKAEQSEGSQGAEVGSLTQETQAGTNLTQSINAAAELIKVLKSP